MFRMQADQAVGTLVLAYRQGSLSERAANTRFEETNAITFSLGRVFT